MLRLQWPDTPLFRQVWTLTRPWSSFEPCLKVLDSQFEVVAQQVDDFSLLPECQDPDSIGVLLRKWSDTVETAVDATLLVQHTEDPLALSARDMQAGAVISPGQTAAAGRSEAGP